MAAHEILGPGDVPSPCINFCRPDRGGKMCLGCYRLMSEIVAWSSYTNPQKQAVLDQLPARRAAQG